MIPTNHCTKKRWLSVCEKISWWHVRPDIKARWREPTLLASSAARWQPASGPVAVFGEWSCDRHGHRWAQSSWWASMAFRENTGGPSPCGGKTTV